jgi:hypothetical protein
MNDTIPDFLSQCQSIDNSKPLPRKQTKKITSDDEDEDVVCEIFPNQRPKRNLVLDSCVECVFEDEEDEGAQSKENSHFTVAKINPSNKNSLVTIKEDEIQEIEPPAPSRTISTVKSNSDLPGNSMPFRPILTIEVDDDDDSDTDFNNWVSNAPVLNPVSSKQFESPFNEEASSKLNSETKKTLSSKLSERLLKSSHNNNGDSSPILIGSKSESKITKSATDDDCVISFLEVIIKRINNKNI